MLALTNGSSVETLDPLLSPGITTWTVIGTSKCAFTLTITTPVP